MRKPAANAAIAFELLRGKLIYSFDYNLLRNQAQYTRKQSINKLSVRIQNYVIVVTIMSEQASERVERAAICICF